MTLFIILTIVSFFRMVIILLIIYYVFKMFMRYVAPRIVNSAANKLFEDMKNKEYQQNRKTTRKGDVTIDYTNKKQKQYKPNEGDYIDFEEIKEKKK